MGTRVERYSNPVANSMTAGHGLSLSIDGPSISIGITAHDCFEINNGNRIDWPSRTSGRLDDRGDRRGILSERMTELE